MLKIKERATIIQRPRRKNNENPWKTERFKPGKVLEEWPTTRSAIEEEISKIWEISDTTANFDVKFRSHPNFKGVNMTQEESVSKSMIVNSNSDVLEQIGKESPSANGLPDRECVSKM